MGHNKPSAILKVVHPAFRRSAPAEQPLSTASISFCPASHSPESFGEDDGLVVDAGEDPSLALLRAVAWKQAQICDKLLHSSLPPSSNALRNIIPQSNGFVHTVVEAYNRHRALIIRPDDVWLAILTQFSFFVNGNAEALRSVFVTHKGKKELVIEARSESSTDKLNRYTMDPAWMASEMTKLMQEHIIDKSLREWILPSFSTTTTTDNATSAIIMMGTMKEYFSYKFCLLCGIPRVTLEGEKRDWEDILHRLERLKEYGVQTIAWYHLLQPILSHFISAYDDPTSPKNLDFWNKVAHFTGGGSGPRYLSGWITAFCVFDEKGQWQGNAFNEHSENAKDSLHLSWAQFSSVSGYRRPGDAPYLELDGFPYPTIDSNDVPCGYIHVNVKLQEVDKNKKSLEFDTMFIAGLIGSEISSTEFSLNGARDAVRPISGWWYFIKGKEQEEKGIGNGRFFHRDAISRVRSLFNKLMGRILSVLYREPRVDPPPSPLKGIPLIPSSPAPRTARSFQSLSRITSEFLKEVCPDACANPNSILHSSFGPTLEDVITQRNGFVATVLECYNGCHALAIRPDDVWIAIITQFSCFLNANSDALRSLFVLYDDKKELFMDVYREDVGLMVQTLVDNMKEQMQNSIIDPELVLWMIPAFSTTNPIDKLVSGIVMMATVKQYFSYQIPSFSTATNPTATEELVSEMVKMETVDQYSTYQHGLLSGIPRVTLEGQRDDWVYILNRIEKLKDFGLQTTAWYQLLYPILSRFVDAFQESNSAENLEFWNKFERFGSDKGQPSGWITAFMVFDEEGRWKGDYHNDATPSGITYPRLDSAKIPAGYAQVGITLQRDIGSPKYMGSLIAGSIGTKIFSSKDESLSDTGTRDSARPALGWWWALSEKGAEPQENNFASPDKFPWRFVDANAFVSSGAIRIVSFEDISDLDFVAISYAWTDCIKNWRKHISSTCSGSTYEERIGRGSKMLSVSTEPANIPDGDGIAHAQLFFTIIAFFVLTRGKKFFWIDILCINQDEEQEKSFYVPRMGELYRRAAETHAYPFGAKIPPSLFSDEIQFPVWETRAWTVQEQILSKHVLFCYVFQGDVRQDVRNIRSSAESSDPELLIDMHTPVLDRYRYADGIFLLEAKGNAITCKMEEESWNTLSTSAWASGADGSALIRHFERGDMQRGLVQGSAYKHLYAIRKSQMSNTAETARISMVRIATERTSTMPEDMIYSMLGVFDLGDFRVEYKIGFAEARLRVFEALSPKMLAQIIGTEWGSKSGATHKDSCLPRVVGSESSPIRAIMCVISLKSAIRDCKYTRNVGTSINCRREKFRVWVADTRIRLDQGYLRAILGNDRLLLMQIASIFDAPEVASIPTNKIPRNFTKVIIVEMSTFGVNSDEEFEASKIDRTAEFVEIGECNTGVISLNTVPEATGKTSLLALYCERNESGTLVNKGTVLILDASAFSTDYSDTVIE